MRFGLIIRGQYPQGDDMRVRLKEDLDAAKFAEDLIRLLSELRRANSELAWRSRQGHRLANKANVASFTIRTDKSISREHCQLSVKSREWLLLEDLESRFGTHLNGARIESPTLCKTGDLVRIGDTEILIR